MLRTKGLSPKAIAPLTVAITAFAVDKITDASTETLVVALIGFVGVILLPPGDVTTDPPVRRRLRRKAKPEVAA